MTDDDNDSPTIDSNRHLVESDHTSIILEVVWDAVYFLVGITAMTLLGVGIYSI